MELPPSVKPEIKYTQLFINNEYVDSVSGKTFGTINPVNEEKICDIQEGDKADIDKAVAAAKAAFDPSSPWRQMTPAQRGKLLFKLADLIERDNVFLASLESLDNGKPYAHAMTVDMAAAVDVLRYYAGYADKIHGQTMECESDLMVYTRREPIGVCAGIIAWNFPLLLFMFKLTPALTCGNTIVIKPAEQTPLTAIHVGSLIKEAGFPPGVVNIVPGYGPTAGSALVSHPDVNKVSFTGSTEIGQLILQGSGKSNMKRVTLECGGKSPLIIFADANLDEALATAHNAIFFNSGQVCVAGSRLYVHEDIYDEFIKKAVEAAKKRKIGDPFELTTESGPQIDKDQFDKILDLIESGKSQGAKILCGGGRLSDKGYFIENTLFADVTQDMRIAQEEIFGPVQCVVKFKSTDEVIKMANDTSYGLAAGLFTKNIDTYIRVSNALQAGVVWVNNYGTSRPYVPFGGFKMSGIGRELGKDGLKHYTETKTVMVKIGNTA